MTLTVRYMGQLRQATGVAQETLEVETACTVAALRQAVVARHGPALAPLLASALVFVADEQVDDNVLLTAGATITWLTPIAGGER